MAKRKGAIFERGFGPLLLLSVGCSASHGDVFTTRKGDTVSACPDAIFCSDFETTPRGLSSAATGNAEVVDSSAHSGSRAFAVSVNAQDDWARIEVPLAGLSSVGVRVWIQLDAAAGDLLTTDRYVLAALHAAPALSTGGINKLSIDLETAFQLVLVDTVDPAGKTRSGFQLERGQWHCLRLGVEADQASLEVDGQLVATNTGVVPEGGFESLYLGVEYSLGVTPVTLYYDDLVVSDMPAPCD